MASELRVVLGQLKRRLRAQANKGDLSLSQLAVLGTLDREGPATVTTLASRSTASTSSLSSQRA